MFPAKETTRNAAQLLPTTSRFLYGRHAERWTTHLHGNALWLATICQITRHHSAPIDFKSTVGETRQQMDHIAWNRSNKRWCQDQRGWPSLFKLIQRKLPILAIAFYRRIYNLEQALHVCA